METLVIIHLIISCKIICKIIYETKWKINVRVQKQKKNLCSLCIEKSNSLICWIKKNHKYIIKHFFY